jgi:CubicO group peptidase (beta-lactamase class C family)
MRFLRLALLVVLPSLAVCATSTLADPTGAWHVRCDRTAAGAVPPVITGVMHVARGEQGWSGDLRFHAVQGILKLTAVTDGGATATLAFEQGTEVELQGSGDELAGRMRAGDDTWSPFTARRVVPLDARAMPDSLPAGQPLAGLDPGAWGTIERTAADEESTAVIVVKDGRVVAERYATRYDGEPVPAMSASKSVVSMAVGCLVAEGKLTLDTRIASLFPEWKGTPKAAITVRHLLNHTSGLSQIRRRDDDEKTIREYTLASPLVAAPGTRFQYNNNATDFLAAVVGAAAGKPLDAYLEERLFGKLNIKGAWWHKDPEGTPLGAGELMIRPVDLAKLGQLMLDGGAWNGEQLLPREWVELSHQPAQELTDDCGLLWWREGEFGRRFAESIFQAWEQIGMEASALAPARALLGQTFATTSAAMEALEKAIGETAVAKVRSLTSKQPHVPRIYAAAAGPTWGYSARGYLGQYLVVYPAARLVAVRMRAPRDTEPPGEEAGYRSFAADVAKLAPRP